MSLKELIEQDPDNAAKTPAEVAAWCNERVLPAPVKTQDVVKYLFLVDKYDDISIAAEAEDAAVNEKTKAARKFLSGLEKFESFDLSVPEHEARIQARLVDLQDHGFISADDKEIILSLGDNKVSRAEAAGLGVVWGRDVLVVRGY